MNGVEVIMGIMAWLWLLGCGAASMVRDDRLHRSLFWIITGLFILFSVLFFSRGMG